MGGREGGWNEGRSREKKGYDIVIIIRVRMKLIM